MNEYFNSMKLMSFVNFALFRKIIKPNKWSKEASSLTAKKEISKI